MSKATPANQLEQQFCHYEHCKTGRSPRFVCDHVGCSHYAVAHVPTPRAGVDRWYSDWLCPEHAAIRLVDMAEQYREYTLDQLGAINAEVQDILDVAFAFGAMPRADVVRLAELAARHAALTLEAITFIERLEKEEMHG